MSIRGIRGAVTTNINQPQAIFKATRELLEAILQANSDLQPEELASVFFTLTEDLDAAYPAEAARQMGWTSVPMLCAKEILVPGSLPGCIRVLLHWNTELPQHAVHHIYLGEAAKLRPDIAFSK